MSAQPNKHKSHGIEQRQPETYVLRIKWAPTYVLETWAGGKRTGRYKLADVTDEFRPASPRHEKVTITREQFVELATKH